MTQNLANLYVWLRKKQNFVKYMIWISNAASNGNILNCQLVGKVEWGTEDFILFNYRWEKHLSIIILRYFVYLQILLPALFPSKLLQSD